jgi:3-phenylpropionate/trans-cinnamate dioxygenase ferredoxin reductase subunit
VGLLSGHNHAVVRGDPATGRFSVIYTSNGTVVAVDTVNSPSDFAKGKALIGTDFSAAQVSLADVTHPLGCAPSAASRM